MAALTTLVEHAFEDVRRKQEAVRPVFELAAFIETPSRLRGSMPAVRCQFLVDDVDPALGIQGDRPLGWKPSAAEIVGSCGIAEMREHALDALA